ncbi:sushi, von Willebrand factor type A, EGF and pentraxin domain-containing protein 1-like isoform X2 [Leptopilina heterotoma]|uniref:sushi, von Willebrand factor type A, EGF and pentraxin domain-containing protein 1-like isoform X2 n=1 Tax=Leptopilina heterotoma TaxID=63436 RepID=UPI001CA8BD2B|nr:sushi, von Willebrand factor type A, EGF and pentraxin domain-containing protein 1-like isoform X2 [Leptopilina heterotoma]
MEIRGGGKLNYRYFIILLIFEFFIQSINSHSRYEIKNGGFHISLIDWTIKPYCDDYFHLENLDSFKPNDRKRTTKILRCMYGRKKIHKDSNGLYFDLNYGKVTLTLLSDRYQFSYICNPGYKLIGEKIIWFIRGKITHSQPICIQILPNVNKMKNGHFTVIDLDSETFEFNYFCNYPYELIGQETVYYFNKTWSAKKPICIISCQPQKLLNGFSSLSLKNDEYMSKFTCNEGFFLDGNKESFCTDGIWIQETPTCIPHCQVKTFSNGQMTLNDDKIYFTMSCNFGYELLGNSKIRCNNGQWSHPFPICFVSPP